MCPAFFINFLFYQMIALHKSYEKCFLFHLKSSFRSRDIQIIFPSLPIFLPVRHCFRGCSKINLKVYEVINGLNKNLGTHFIWYLGKKKRCDIETLSVDRVLNREYFYGKYAEHMHQKLVPDPLLILVNNPKHSLHAINFFENKIFWKRILKVFKKWTLFFLSNPLPFNVQSYQKHKGPGTSAQMLFRLQSKFRKILLLVIYYLTKFDDVIYSGFWVIRKFTSANLYKPIHDITNYSTSICPFESGKFE